MVERINDDHSVQVAWQHDGPDGQAVTRATLDERFIRAGGLRLGYAMTAHKTEGLTVAADWTAPDGSTQQGSVLVQAAGLDQAGFHVATSRHKGQVHIFAGRDQLEDLPTSTSKEAPTSDAELTSRVRDELAKTAKRTAENINDSNVHEDLGQTPAADAKAMTAEERLAALQQIRDNLDHATPKPQPQPQPQDPAESSGPVHEPPAHNL